MIEDNLKKMQSLILLAEIGALIHDLGKLSKDFIEAINSDAPDMHYHILRLHHLCPTDPRVAAFESAPSIRQFVQTVLPSSIAHWVTEREKAVREAKIEKCIRELREQEKEKRKQVTNQLVEKGLPREEIERQIRNERAALLSCWEDCVREIKESIDLGNLEHRQDALQMWLSKVVKGEISENEESFQRQAQEAMEAVKAHYERLRREKAIPDGFIPSELPDQLLGTKVDALSESVSLASYVEMHHSSHWNIPYLIKLLKAKPWEGVDGFDSWIDKGQVSDEAKQLISRTFIATAFGYEPESQRIEMDALTQVRHRYANALAKALQRIRKATGGLSTAEWLELLCDPRTGLRACTQVAFRQALGETRRSANDVTLWDHCYSTASLYKASLTKVILESALDEEYEFPSPSTIGWRFLRIGVNGLEFFGQAHHVTDLLGRRDALEKTLDEVRHTLEVEYPLGNEIYRDENGSIFVMPALGDNADHRALVEEMTPQVEEAFRQMGQGLDMGSELIPRLTWNDEGAVRGMDDNGDLPDMRIAFGKLVSQTPGAITADPLAVDTWWREPQSANKEICTVCGVRPVGYKPPGMEMPRWVTSDKAEKRHICCICLNRRGRRAETWLTKHPHQTIWADEVVDVNGRFALIVGRFELDQWLNGTLVRTMLIAPDKSKNPSPARIRRCWETTHKFWQEIEPEAILDTLDKRTRLEIIPQNKKELLDGLGAYHTYELDINGQRMGVIWDPVSKHLLTTEHLADLVRRWNVSVEEGNTPFTALQRWLQRYPYKTWSLYEPSGYGEPAREKEQDVVFDDAKGSEIPYTPCIPLLTEPALFMALVPADKAMGVMQVIKQKYEREMSKVQDRLPLHLGVVIAQRRTPLRAVLEAGRALLGARGKGLGTGGWEKWSVKEAPEERGSNDEPAYLTEDNQHFEEWWDVSLKRNGREMKLRFSTVMGDGETPDVWYPHLLKRPLAPGEAMDAETDLVHVKSLNEDDAVYVAPSTFDFEYLDTTARRFEIAYDGEGQRRGCPPRPYLLNEIDDLQRAWDLISGRLTPAQWMALDGLIERKRQEWSESRGPSADYSEAFKHLVYNALRNAEWKWKVNGEIKKGWKNLSDKEQENLKRAALQGILNDVINLYHEAMKEKSEEE